MAPLSKRDQVWQRPRVEEICSAAEREPAAHPDRWPGVLKALRVSRHDDYVVQVEKFARARALLQAADARHARQSVQAAFDRASGILALAGIRSTESRLAYLYTDLTDLLARYHLRCGRLVAGRWLSLVAGAEPAGDPPPELHYPSIDEESVRRAHLAFLGEAVDDNPTIERVAALWSERLGGRAMEVQQELLHLRQLDSEASGTSPALAWELAFAEAQLFHHADAIAAQYRLRRPGAGTGAIAKLWTLALPGRSQVGRLPRMRTATAEGNCALAAATFCSAVERAYDARTPLWTRLVGLADPAEAIAAQGSFESRLLSWLALARLCGRLKQTPLARYGLAHYRALSSSLPGDPDADRLGLADSMPVAVGSPDAPSPERLRESVGERLLELVKGAVKIGGTLSRARLQRLLGGDGHRFDLKETEAAELAAHVARTLATLRGPAAKLGQLMSYAVPGVPPSVCAPLALLQHHNPPVPFETIVRQLRLEYGRPLHRVFASIDPQPIGVGSVAQVHRALTIDGRSVALKIKFPGIEKVFESDLRILARLLPALRLLAPKFHFESLFSELKTQLLGETDLAQERRCQEQLGAFASGIGAVRVPRVFEDLCTDSVLAMELVRGRSLEEFRLTATPDERNRAGEEIVRFVVACLLRGFFNTDPNPANFLFRDGKVYFLDFGSIKTLEPAVRKHASYLMESMLDRNFELFKVALRGLGFVRDARRFDFRAAFDGLIRGGTCSWVDNVTRPIDLEHLGRHLRHTAALKPKRHATEGERKPRSPSRKPVFAFPSQLLFFFRIYFGHQVLLAKLGAHANWHRVVRSCVEEFGCVTATGSRSKARIRCEVAQLFSVGIQPPALDPGEKTRALADELL